MKKTKLVLAFVGIFCVTETYAATCPVSPASPIILPKIAGITAATTAGMTALQTALSAQLLAATDAVVASANSFSSQTTLATQVLNRNLEKTTELTHIAKLQEEENKAKEEAVEDVFKGGGYNPCLILEKRADIVRVQSEKNNITQRSIAKEITARSGRYSDRNKAIAERLTIHDSLYCTEDQVNSGLCQATGRRAGRSTDFAVLFENVKGGSDSYKDKSAFINNIVGLPDDPVDADRAQTTLGQSYMDNKRRLDSIKSTAISSLKSIQDYYSTSAGEKNDGAHVHESINSSESDIAKNISKIKGYAESKDHDQSKDTLILKIKDDVGRYYGGEEYEDWSKSVVALNERGVLQELVKQEALRLYLQSLQYDELHQMEAGLATLTAAEIDTQMSKKTAKLRSSMVKVNAFRGAGTNPNQEQ